MQLGPMLVSPSRRLIEGPGGHTHVEPLTMQVFLLLFDAGGKVVTRNNLFDQCWGGGIVGDDSLNRAIAKVRRIGADAAPGLFEIETIPRTGYRLRGQILAFQDPAQAANPEGSVAASISRRKLVGVAAAAAALSSGGLWSARTRRGREFAFLMKRGNEALATRDPDFDSTEYFRKAVALRPDDAEALGSLAFAYATRMESGQREHTRTSLQQAETAAAAALGLDPNEPNAHLALVIIESGSLDLLGTEDRLRDVLAAHPSNLNAMNLLWNLLQCVGRSQEALGLVRRALRINPLASGSHYPFAQLLWITGQTAEADRVIEKAMQYWPTHRFVRFARFMIFAFTDRPRAAMAMIEKPETSPQNFPPESIALWRLTLPALDQRSSIAEARAREAVLAAVMKNLRLTSQAAMVMSALGDIDTAFAITDKFFAVDKANPLRPKSPMSIRSTAWRFAPWLFTPPIAGMRADPRFTMLTDEIGLSAYWHARQTQPDYQA